MLEKDRSLELLAEAKRRMAADAHVPARTLFEEMVTMGLVNRDGKLVVSDPDSPPRESRDKK